MSKDLMIPRYKVIADYPGNPFKEGSVLTITEIENRMENAEHMMQSYPHLFKKLEWWQERDPKDLPLFLKDKFDRLFKVRSLDGKYLSAWLEGDSFPRSLAFYTPCH